MSKEQTKKTIFISYSSQDSLWLEKLNIFLKPLIRSNNIIVWDDTNILPGEERKSAIQDVLSKTKVAILLVSQNFLASDFIYNEELPELLKALKIYNLTILWIPISFSLYEETEIKEFQPMHDPLVPLDSLPDNQQNRILVSICKKIKLILDEQLQTIDYKDIKVNLPTIITHINFQVIASSILLIILVYITYYSTIINTHNIKISETTNPDINRPTKTNVLNTITSVDIILKSKTIKCTLKFDINKNISDLKYFIIDSFKLNENVKAKDYKPDQIIDWFLLHRNVKIIDESLTLLSLNFQNYDYLDINYQWITLPKSVNIFYPGDFNRNYDKNIYAMQDVSGWNNNFAILSTSYFSTENEFEELDMLQISLINDIPSKMSKINTLNKSLTFSILTISTDLNWNNIDFNLEPNKNRKDSNGKNKSFGLKAESLPVIRRRKKLTNKSRNIL